MSVYESLRRMIVVGDISEDGRVSEAVLAERLGVSRTPVREALQRLEGDGLVLAQGRGVRVRTLTTTELDELHLARAGLEGWAAERAAHRVAQGLIAPVHLTRLDELAQEAHEHTMAGDLARAVEANRSFHEGVSALAGNSVINTTLRGWWDQITVSTRRSLRAPERTQVVHDEHHEILRALRTGNPDASRAAVQAHALATRAALTTSTDDVRSAS